MNLGFFALPAAVVLAFATAVAGCGGGADPLTLEQYFAEYEAIEADIDGQIDVLYGDYPEDADALTDDANLPYFKALATAFTSIMDENVDRLGNLNPPSEVVTEHDKLVEAGDDLVAAFENGAEVIDEAETMAGFEALNSEVAASLADPISQFDEACVALVDIAAANDIAVILTCEN